MATDGYLNHSSARLPAAVLPPFWPEFGGLAGRVLWVITAMPEALNIAVWS